MIPRTEIECISVEEEVSELLTKFTETEHSKLIVYRESLDQVLGYVHTSSMFKNPNTIEEAVQTVLVVPETMQANVVLSEFTKNRKSIAIVVDEFGGTEGMITIEDLVEEVFGEIEDEHDVPEEEELLAKQLDENTWLFSARCEVDEVNKEFELDLPEGEYNTLSGLVMFVAEDIPEVNAVLQMEAYNDHHHGCGGQQSKHGQDPSPIIAPSLAQNRAFSPFQKMFSRCCSQVDFNTYSV